MDILTERQKSFLKLFGGNALAKQSYLTGGTALAGFYLQHRYSEDLDFFSENEVDALSVSAFLKSIQNKLGFVTLDSQQSYNRNLFFVHFKDGEILKTEFTYFPFLRIEKGKSVEGVELDSLVDIAVNKLFTVHQRSKARDYIDLYCLCTRKGFAIADLVAKARIKFDSPIDPLQLGTQFAKAEQAKDYPRMISDIKPAQWQDWFIQQANLLKKQILTE